MATYDPITGIKLNNLEVAKRALKELETREQQKLNTAHELFFDELIQMYPQKFWEGAETPKTVPPTPRITITQAYMEQLLYKDMDKDRNSWIHPKTFLGWDQGV